MFFFLPALAEPAAIVDDGSLVHEITWARPFELQTPHPYRYTAKPREITRGWLVEVVVEGWTMVPRQHGVPNLWVGDQVAGRTSWAKTLDPGPMCAVFWVPGPLDLSNAPVFFGTTGLAERIDDAKRAGVLEAAKGLQNTKRSDVVGDSLKVAEFGALMTLAATRCQLRLRR